MTKRPNAIPLRPDYPSTAGKFARACFAVAQGGTLGGGVERFMPADDPVVPLIVHRSIAAPGATDGCAADLARQAFGRFLADLAPYSGAARLIAQAVPAVLVDGKLEPTTYPKRTGRSAPAFVGELDPIPVGSFDFDSVEIGPQKKMAHILAWSRELGRRSDAEAIFDLMLREDFAAGVDTAFFASTAGSAIVPAGLLNGVTPLSPTVVAGREAVVEDLIVLANAVATGGSGAVTFVMAPQRLAVLRILASDIAENADIAASAAVPADRVIAADGPSLLVALGSEPDVFATKVGTLHMSDQPLEIVSDTGPTTADPVRSLWQTASSAVRIIYDLDFTKRRAGAVAYMDGASRWLP
jgi:hypothetical protein